MTQPPRHRINDQKVYPIADNPSQAMDVSRVVSVKPAIVGKKAGRKHDANNRMSHQACPFSHRTSQRPGSVESKPAACVIAGRPHVGHGFRGSGLGQFIARQAKDKQISAT